MRRLRFLACLTCLAALSAHPALAAQKSIRQTIASDKNYSSLRALINNAGMAKELSGKTKYTLIAPTNKAFKALGTTSKERLSKDPPYARTVLRYHLLKGSVKAADLLALSGKTIAPLQGEPFPVAIKGAFVFLGTNAKLIKTDVEASNGLIHVSNRVLLPPTE